MNKSWIIFRVVGAIVAIGLLVAGGFALYNAAWTQGYAASSAAATAMQLPQPAFYTGLYGLGLVLFPAVLLGLALMLGLRLLFRPFMRPWMGYGYHPQHMWRHFHKPVDPAWQKCWEEYMKAETGKDASGEKSA